MASAAQPTNMGNTQGRSILPEVTCPSSRGQLLGRLRLDDFARCIAVNEQKKRCREQMPSELEDVEQEHESDPRAEHYIIRKVHRERRVHRSLEGAEQTRTGWHQDADPEHPHHHESLDQGDRLDAAAAGEHPHAETVREPIKSRLEQKRAEMAQVREK